MSSNIRYYNASAPWWDWVAQWERNGFQHPLANAYNGQQGEENDDERTPGPEAFRGGWGGRGRGRHCHGRGRSHHGRDAAPRDPPTEVEGEQARDPPEDVPEGPSAPGAWPPGADSNNFPFGQGPHGRGPWGGPWGGRGRGFPGRGRGGPFGRAFNMSGLREFIQSQMNPESGNRDAEDFVPPVDVFDTEGAFVVHISLAGAKKEDIAVTWDAEKSELNVSGVIYRPGSEEFLKTLALDERQVGAFEKKIRLGSPMQPAKVEEDAITAKLEDGILKIEVPKEDRDFVDVMKVDVN